MHVQIKSEPFEYFSSLILVLFLISLSLLVGQLCLTIYQASGGDKGLSAESQILQDILFCFGGFFWLVVSGGFFGGFFWGGGGGGGGFPLACDLFMSFHVSFFAFFLCHQLLPFWVFFVVPSSLVLSAPCLCIISPSQTLGLHFPTSSG